MASDPKPGWRRVQLSRKDRILRSTGLHHKTPWDWLQLLVVPIVIALLAGLFTTVQILYQQAREERLQARITQQNAEIQRFIEEQRAQSASIGAYLDLMTKLLLERNLNYSEENSVVRAIAQAQTTRVLRDADPSGKQTVLLFLRDSGLLDGRSPIVDLSNADLSDADLSGTDLRGANLSGTDLRGANLSGADLSEANLSVAGLNNADLRDATMSGANLSGAKLNFANLSRAVLNKADLPDADLSGANMSDAFLRYADLREAQLIETNLSGADLLRADLGYARLNGAKGVTEEQLKEQAKTIKGATMPDGSIPD